MADYVHGYSDREAQRLCDQAQGLAELLHHDTRYPSGSLVLEAGCGVGAQTVLLARNSPRARFTSIDLSADSLAQAERRCRQEGLTNVAFQRADLFDLPFPDNHFDFIFLCFVLEHLTRPAEALRALMRVLKPGGTLTSIEGDHGSCYFAPETPESLTAWRALVSAQARLGGDSLIGRRLYPLLRQAGFPSPRVSPRMVYSDNSRPVLEESFVRLTIIPMVEGVRDLALEMKLATPESWEQGIQDLHRTASPEGTFCYCFFKGVAEKPKP
ncbi:MAG TPA: methyltransferase domain-containing protein [Armatimonadota bacterium]